MKDAAMHMARERVPGMVSVVIPAYNHERYVLETIGSVLDQDHDQLEVIVIDDGSSDRTPELLESLTDPRITLLRQENQGTGPTYNRGLALTRGEYVSLLNSDDVYAPGRIKRLLRHMQDHPEHELVFTGVTLVDENGKPHTSGADHEWLQMTYAYMEQHPSLHTGLIYSDFACTSSNYFFRSTLINRIGWFHDLRYANDYDFLLRAVRRNVVGFVREPLLFYRKHETSTLNESVSEGQVQFWVEVSWLFAEYLRHRETLTQLDMEELCRVLDLHNSQNAEIVLFYLLYFLKDPDRDPEELLHDPAVRSRMCDYVSWRTIPIVEQWRSTAPDYKQLYEEVVDSRTYRFINALKLALHGKDITANLKAAWAALASKGS